MTLQKVMLALFLTLSVASPVGAELEVNGRKYDEQKLFSFKNVPLGISLKDFKKLNFPSEATDSQIQLSTDRDFVTPAPTGFQYPPDGKWVVAVFRRKNSMNNVVTTTIANYVVTPIFAFAQTKVGEYRLVKFALLGGVSHPAKLQDAISTITSALEGRFGTFSTTVSGSGNIQSWSKGDSTITLQTLRDSFKVTYALSGFEPYQLDSGKPPEQDL